MSYTADLIFFVPGCNKNAAFVLFNGHERKDKTKREK